MPTAKLGYAELKTTLIPNPEKAKNHPERWLDCLLNFGSPVQTNPGTGKRWFRCPERLPYYSIATSFAGGNLTLLYFTNGICTCTCRKEANPICCHSIYSCISIQSTCCSSSNIDFVSSQKSTSCIEVGSV